MATPQWVRFSSSKRSIHETLRDSLSPVYEAFHLRLWVITELGLLADGTMGDTSKPFIECNSVQEALELSKDWKGVAFTFIVEAIHRSVGFHVWRDGEETNICMFVPAEISWFESREDIEGEWLIKFLEEVCVALKVDCCGYGNDPQYDFVYAPLEAANIVRLLRSGDLFQMHQPVIHLISNETISRQEIEALMKMHSVRPGLQYRQTETNYHLIFNFRPPALADSQL